MRKFRFDQWTKNDSIDLVRLINKPNTTILDIGANDGQQSLWLASLFQNPQVFSFEPDPRAIEKFRKRISKENIFLHTMALGASDLISHEFRI